MDITNINLGACPLQYLSIGYVGETGARPVKFDFSAWATEYGSGVLQLHLQRPGDADPYPVLLDIDGTTATWTPDATATEKTGQGQAQLVYTVGGVIVKNAIFRVLIAPSLGTAGNPPEPYEDWLERLLTIAAEAQQSAIDAAGSAEAAGTSAGAAAGSAGAAAQSALDAEAAKSGAESAETAAGQSAALAGEKATQATQAAQTAAQKATDAQQSEADAAAASTAARLAADAAKTFADNAEAAEVEANQAKTDAQSAAAAAAAAVTEVETKGAQQIQAINQAGATQIAAVDAAGAAQVQAIEDKGEEVLASIPADYSELSADVDDLKSSIKQLADTLSPMTVYPISRVTSGKGILAETGAESRATHRATLPGFDLHFYNKLTSVPPYVFLFYGYDCGSVNTWEHNALDTELYQGYLKNADGDLTKSETAYWTNEIDVKKLLARYPTYYWRIVVKRADESGTISSVGKNPLSFRRKPTLKSIL